MPNEPIYVEKTLFLGRVEEQKQFRNALREVLTAPPDEDLPYIILLYGDGGMGKTTLAKRFRDIALFEQPFEGEFQTLWIDWEDERNRSAALKVGRENISPEVVFDIIHTHCVKKSWGRHFTTYQEAVKERIETEKKVVNIVSSSGEGDEFAPLRGAGASVIAKVIRLSLPIGATGEKFAQTFLDAGIKVGAEKAANLRTALEKRLRSRLDPKMYDLFLNPNEQLARALADGLKRVSSSQPLIIFLDTYEIVDRADIWLRVAMYSAGPNVIWIVGGRDNLVRSGLFGQEYFKGYADQFPRRLLTYDLRQLAEQDIRTLFTNRAPNRVLDDEAVEGIRRATLGVPLALDEVAEMWAKGIPLEQIVGDTNEVTARNNIVHKMTARYLLHAITNEADKLAIYAIALAQGDIDLLRSMLRPANNAAFDLDTLLHCLERDYTSVSYTYARLHDEPAFFIRQFLKEDLQRSEDIIKSLIQRAVETLRARLTKIQAEYLCLDERCDDEDWTKAALSLTEYLFWLDESEAWHWLIPYFVASLAYSTDLRQGLIQIAQGWEDRLSRKGKKRLHLLRDGIQRNASPKAKEDLLNELLRLRRLGWLNGNFENEYMAILEWMHGLLLYESGNHKDAWLHYEQSERHLPECGEVLKKVLGEGMYHLSGKYIWPQDVIDSSFSTEATQMLESVVKWLPEKHDAWYRLGATIVQSNKLEDAIPYFQHAIHLDPSYAAPHNALGNVHLNLGRYEEALADFQQAIQLDPDFSAPYNGLGSVYQSLGRYKEALAAFQQAAQLDPNIAYPKNGLGNVYGILGMYEEALAAFQQAIQLDQKFAYSYNGLGNVYDLLGRYEEALAAYQQAIRLDPKLTHPRNKLGSLYRTLGRYEEALAAYQQAIQLDPNFATLHNELGNVFQILGRFEEALAAYQQAIQLDPQDAYPYNGLGSVYYKLGRYKEALPAYQQAILLDPKFASQHRSLGNVYYSLGKYEESLSAYQEAIQLDPKDAYQYIGLGNVFSQLGRYEEALAVYQQAIQLDPKEAIPHSNLAGIHIHFRRLDEAIEELQERIRLGPSNTFNPLVSLGVIFYHQGLDGNVKYFKDALEQWEIACRFAWQTPSGLLENRAIALLCLGKKEEALMTIKEATAKMLPGDTINFDLYNLLLTAPTHPEGLDEMIAILKEAQNKR